MPKPISERQTSNRLGQKLNEVMREKGIEGDYAALATVFGVKTPSVYDWITHGPLGKERYACLVEWSGRGLSWWFDVPEPSREEKPTSTVHTLMVAESNSTYEMNPASQKSPFPRISNEEWALLAPHEVREIETYAMGLMAGIRMHTDLKSQNGA